jgi:tRNA-uridine 2-sulfurtransferase
MENRFCNKPISDTKIVVAMSGGVDSSTVAALLHHEGYQVIGITLQLYDLGVTLEKKGACCAGQDIYDAKNVADKLGFPHYVLNYESLFKQEVIEDFADSYLRGETPIPCVKCNQTVKFKDLLQTAKDLGADAMATGHYVQHIKGEFGSELHCGADIKKDQSYFLFATTKEQLSFTYFPLGGFSKEETRALARKYDLEIADKPDSQDICFVPNGSYANLIEKLRPNALDSGDIVDMSGNILGRHNGIINYTIGQRKGIGIAHESPLYVVKLDAAKKQVIVGYESDLHKSRFLIKEINWLGRDEDYKEAVEVTVKLRSTHMPKLAKIYPQDNNSAIIELLSSEKAITPGQACVFYNNSQVLGGGWIVKVLN